MHLKFHKLMCSLGLHSLFLQEDRWGLALVCRYCSVTRALPEI